MNKIERSALVSYSAQQMMDLVNNIESYPEFLPWCSASEILHQEQNQIKASINIAKSGINKSFTTQNQSIENKIQMELIDGPFKYLNGLWEFTPLNANACKVSLILEFELAGKFLEAVFGGVFNSIANTMVDAFCEQAEVIYGKE